MQILIKLSHSALNTNLFNNWKKEIYFHVWFEHMLIKGGNHVDKRCWLKYKHKNMSTNIDSFWRFFVVDCFLIIKYNGCYKHCVQNTYVVQVPKVSLVWPWPSPWYQMLLGFPSNTWVLSSVNGQNQWECSVKHLQNFFKIYKCCNIYMYISFSVIRTIQNL